MDKFFDTVEEAIEDIKNGKMVIIADDEDRENEGDLVCAAELVTPEIINFMTQKGRGLICTTVDRKIAKRLNLHKMVEENTESHGCAFTVSVDAQSKFGTTTGISANDRAPTIKVIVDENSKPDDLRRPGHIFPIQARKGGVLERVGQTEASVDIARLAGLKPAGVICEILKEDGTMARRDDLRKFADENNLKFITVAQLISYRLTHERFVKRMASANLPTAHGTFEIIGYKNELDGVEHVALVKGLDDKTKTPAVRMHSECLTGDVFHSLKCDCGDQLANAMEYIEKAGCGAIIYLRHHEGRGIGLVNKIKAYCLQEKGRDTVEANVDLGFAPDLRDYGVGAQILLDLGLTKFNLITNNPKKIIALEGYGIEILDRIAIPTPINKYNEFYMKTKKDKMEHILSL
ncbi:MAG: bifunctional 3,4-dihydroxy-2-butanone-4-phosphate synthase/GTP cyclohydrolase II [Candidatus Gastranaerophilales bacterium]|nr:bifunctional 3,4-dihydroxy-2-butanone-4-phosphate synthase/GTP cyclohydrolase II [Candidatus Gastranaerophilales bacterium]